MLLFGSKKFQDNCANLRNGASGNYMYKKTQRVDNGRDEFFYRSPVAFIAQLFLS